MTGAGPLDDIWHWLREDPRRLGLDASAFCPSLASVHFRRRSEPSNATSDRSISNFWKIGGADPLVVYRGVGGSSPTTKFATLVNASRRAETERTETGRVCGRHRLKPSLLSSIFVRGGRLQRAAAHFSAMAKPAPHCALLQFAFRSAGCGEGRRSGSGPRGSRCPAHLRTRSIPSPTPLKPAPVHLQALRRENCSLPPSSPPSAGLRASG